MENVMDDNKTWLIEHGDLPIQYQLTHNTVLIEDLLKNEECYYWLGQLKQKVSFCDMSNIHGSHDYRTENILGKCWLLGMRKEITEFDTLIKMYIDFLDVHVNTRHKNETTYQRIYAYYDYETVLSCFLPFLGYSSQPSVISIANKRINYLYNFTKEKRYDIYVDGSKYSGVKKEWQPLLINPELYVDGNLSIPSVHDVILLAGMYCHLNETQKKKTDTIISWILDEKYLTFKSRYGYIYSEDDSYKAKSLIRSFDIPEIDTLDESKMAQQSIIFKTFILSHFMSSRNIQIFNNMLTYLRSFRLGNRRYIFSRSLLNEKKDSYFTEGGHMNIGENKHSKVYQEVVSTFWMYLIEGLY
jgi:hypothetical protein